MVVKSVIPTERIINRLKYENPWWVTGQVDKTYTDMKRRLYFKLFFPFVEETEVKRALILMGPRRVGKTVLLFHSISQLLQNNISPRDICFIGIDNPIYINLSLEDMLSLYKEAMVREDLKGCFVFFDEIQYLKDWQRHLKVLVDSYPETKFIASGSAAAALSYGSSESGAGRFTDFMLPPLTFQEFIYLKDLTHLLYEGDIEYNKNKTSYLLTNNLDELNREFVNYLNFGGYPEVVLSEKMKTDMGRYIKSDILDKVLLRDLPNIYGIRDIQELYRFFTYLAYHTGKEFSYSKMSKESGINVPTLKSYLGYLEAAFLIKVLNKVDINSKGFKRIMHFKVYLTNPSLRTALFSPVENNDEEIGNMVETAIFSQWLHRDNLDLVYARWNNGNKKGEVDLIQLDKKKFKPDWGVEIKWSNRYFKKPTELKSLIQFCKANQLDAALVTTISEFGVKQADDLNFTFLPASVYAYNIGNRTLKMKGSDDWD